MTTTDQLIVYSNTHNGLGIRILSAKRPTKKSGIYIKEILPNGLAQRDGRLKVGDQVLSINDEITIGIQREYAINILRCAAATNQVRLYIRHFPSAVLSNEYQKLLFDEKFTDDDQDEENDQEIYRILNQNPNRSFDENHLRTPQSLRKHHHNPQESRHSVYNFSYEKIRTTNGEQNSKEFHLSNDALQSLFNSKFKIIDLIDLLKKTYPHFLCNQQRKELEFLQQLSEKNSDGRISLKDFEKESSLFFGHRINLLHPFYSLSSNSSKDQNEMILELKQQLANAHQSITKLQEKIVTCEKSQRLSEEIESEYEDVFKYLYKQFSQLKCNQSDQMKVIQQNHLFMQRLFLYLSNHQNKSMDQQLLLQFKQQYQRFSSAFNFQLDNDSHSVISDQI